MSASPDFRITGLAGRTPLLTVHGLVSSTQHWRAFTPHYATTRPVIAWDYRGHGGRAAPTDARAVGVETFARDAHDVVAAVGQGPVVACGLSFGVQVALEMWRADPRDIRALVLLCGTAGHPLDRFTRSALVRRAFIALARSLDLRPMLALARTRLGRRLACELAYLSGGADRAACPREVLDDLFAHVGALEPALISEVVASYLAHDAHDVLPTIDVPTLIIAGDHDQLTPVATAERMRDAIPGSHLVVFPGRSHLAQVEDPIGVHAAIDAFLAAHAL